MISPEDGPVRIDVLQRLAEQAMSDPTFRDEARDDLPATLVKYGYDLTPRSSRWSFASVARLPTRGSISTSWTGRATSDWPTSSNACNAAPGARVGPDAPVHDRCVATSRARPATRLCNVDRIDGAPVGDRPDSSVVLEGESVGLAYFTVDGGRNRVSD